MKTAVIFSGGNIDEDLALCFVSGDIQIPGIENCKGNIDLSRKIDPSPYIIAADRGLLFLEKHGIEPDLVVGDFDSSPSGYIDRYRLDHPGVPIRTFQPEKDYTDTEIAVSAALEAGTKEIIILGGTGTRIDHVIGNIQVLEQIADKGGRGVLLDPNNRITLHRESFRLDRKSQWGTYISLFAWGGGVSGLTLTGFHYGLKNFHLTTKGSLGVSNELEAETGLVEFSSGQVLMIESKD